MAQVAEAYFFENDEVGPGDSPPKRRRQKKFRLWRLVVLVVAAVYFVAPLYAGLKFALQNDLGKFSFWAFTSLPKEQGFSAAFFLSMRLALFTALVELVLMVPTSIYVHLRLPKLRPVMDFVTILPIVVPPIVLIVGVLGSAPLFLKSSPYLLSIFYVVLAMPFVYRSLDAGLSAIDLRTLVEASRSLGGSWLRTLWSVIMPNLRAALLSATALTLALVFGEYTMANLDGWTTMPVWIAQFQQSDAHVTVAASMALLIGTWLLLSLIVALDRSQSRRRRRKAGTL
jgi:putative spermidine/putrescine transport system permease protein